MPSAILSKNISKAIYIPHSNFKITKNKSIIFENKIVAHSYREQINLIN